MMDDRQDVRLAVVLNGGVSLAVWMSGVAAELNRLVAASRRDPARGPGYAALLDLLEATASVDVIAGTSAGGINGGFLAVGAALGGPLDGLGTLWAERGGFADLLRDPVQRDPASLLRGDDYFLPALQRAYGDLFQKRQEPIGNVDLFLTGTLYSGRRSRFTDDMGARIDEIDHDTTFHFCSDGSCPSGDLREAATMDKVAAASRCTSSFPGAFEPHYVRVEGDAVVDDRDARRWATTAGPATFDTSQYVIDGGILLNKPIRPALEAIYRKPAEGDVRRVLAYVAPTPGGRAAPVAGQAVPRADQVVLSVLTRLRATDSVARELTEIRRTNEAVGERRATRARLVALLDRQATELAGDPVVWQGYRQERRRLAARTISRLIAGGGGSPWSVAELSASILRQPDPALTFVPPDADVSAALARTGSAWQWGQTTVERLGAIAIDVLKRAIAATPREQTVRRAAVAEHRRNLYDVLAEVWATRDALNAYWRNTAARPVTADLDTWMRQALADWDSEHQRKTLHDQATRIAGVLAAACADLLPSTDADLTALVTYLCRDDTAVLTRMLLLDVTHVALAGVLDQPEQQVELVQVSALDSELLTGLQAHHFGAFYRKSWRVSDWLRGRVDGTVRLCQLLLSPVRLQQLALSAGAAYQGLRAVATGGDTFLAAAWDADEQRIRAELAYLDEPGRGTPARLECIAGHLARRIQLEFLSGELDALAAAVRADDPAAPFGQHYRSPDGDARAAFSALHDAEAIGRQRLGDQVGTDDFARVSSRAAAVTVNIAAAAPQARAARSVLRALRGYALLVWTAVQLVTARGRAGPRVVGFAVTLGAAAVAVSLFAPGVPMIVLLAGLLLVLAGLTTGALFVPAGTRLGLRLLIPALVLLAAVIAVGVRDKHVFTTDLLVKSGVVVALIVFGSYLGRVKGKATKT
ncbi:patatin-like protein [Actinoplanes sp. N902-109]|uniref:patatin-like protein n=1 Tax=Actinoplanes sp. (strain N902-109) TaxID=649831 RepID=UPI0003293944|nr:patatin-like protein [Actinoplanes sp. N902-109]AGL19303.1 patatin [Actinoplanes sp. N902-109]